MRKLLALALLSFPILSAQSAEKSVFNWTFSGRVGGVETMVSCSYVEPLIEEWLGKFGATFVEVDCTGGMSGGEDLPLRLRVEYVDPDLSHGARTVKEEVSSDGSFANCEFDTNLMSGLLPEFPNVKTLSSMTKCSSPESPYSYSFEVQLPK